eukprot:GEMP01060005.1.p1 GENE.GEMP01060005.1~~GEMP01060005.1.p1  ORF type:complete len:215 (+),score=29.64 GEMP01060005.1:363-1007(+)
MTSTISAPEKTPIIFQNPDGSYTEGLPNGYKYPTPSRSSEASHPWMFLGSGNPAETNHDVPPPEEDDFDYTIARHIRLFICFLVVQLEVEVGYLVFFFFGRNETISIIEKTYAVADPLLAQRIFWSAFSFALGYCIVHYYFAMVAVFREKPRHYANFCTACWIGFFCQVALASVSKLNLLVLLFRLVAYLYAKFLYNLYVAHILIYYPDATSQI